MPSLTSSRELPQNENNMKIEAYISLRRRDEEVKVHGEPDCWSLGSLKSNHATTRAKQLVTICQIEWSRSLEYALKTITS